MLKELIKPIMKHIKLSLHRVKWRRINKHNFTTAKSIFPIQKVKVGNYTYGSLDISFFGNPKEKIAIGNYCSIAGSVKILAGGGHDYNCLSTYPFKRHTLKDASVEALTKGPVIIDDDVWIGHGVIILSGVTIGQGSVIAAGSIVAKDVPPYSIFVGNRVIKYRFSQDIINKLMKFDFSDIGIVEIKANIGLIYSEVNDEFFQSAFYNKHLKKTLK